MKEENKVKLAGIIKKYIDGILKTEYYDYLVFENLQKDIKIKAFPKEYAEGDVEVSSTSCCINLIHSCKLDAELGITDIAFAVSYYDLAKYIHEYDLELVKDATTYKYNIPVDEFNSIVSGNDDNLQDTDMELSMLSDESGMLNFSNYNYIMDAKGNCDNIDWDIMKMVAGLDAKLHKTHSVYMYCRDADITMHITDGGNDLKGVVNVVFQGNIASRHLDSLRTLAYNSNIICAAGNTTLMTRIYTVCEFIKEMGYYVIDSREVMYNVEE